jgi:hypothetical protein
MKKLLTKKALLISLTGLVSMFILSIFVFDPSYIYITEKDKKAIAEMKRYQTQEFIKYHNYDTSDKAIMESYYSRKNKVGSGCVGDGCGINIYYTLPIFR